MQAQLADRGTQFIRITAQTPHRLAPNEIEAFENLDLIYRTLCALLYNFVPTSGHPGGSISSGRIVAGILYGGMNYDFSNPDNPASDLIAYAAGHKAMGLYSMWACRNEIMRLTHSQMLPNINQQLRLEDLLGFRKNNNTSTPLFREHKAKALDGHPTPFVPFVPLATGASGVGVAAAVGLALALKDLYPSQSPVVNAIEGEGGLTPGRVHEALAAAATSGLNNFICHVDWNQASIDSNRVCREGDARGDYVQWEPKELFQLHGFNVISVDDGKDFCQIAAALEATKMASPEHPTAIIYRTIKGWRYGIEGNKSHGAGHAFASPEFYKFLGEFESHFKLNFPRFAGNKTPEAVEKNFYDCLMVIRKAIEDNVSKLAVLGRWISESAERLKRSSRSLRPSAPDLSPIFQNELNPTKPPESCTYKAGGNYTLRAALADVLNHVNIISHGGVLAAAADLYGSTSINVINKGFGDGFWHPKNNPTTRLVSAGGITEDAIGAIMAGIATVGRHIGVGSSYGAFIAPLNAITARLHGIAMQARCHRNPSLQPVPFIAICGHAGIKTGEDGPTHAEPNTLQVFQDNYPKEAMVTLTPWDPNELWPLMTTSLKKRFAVIAPFVTRPNEPIIDRAALGLAPAADATKGVYRLLKANGRGEGAIVYQGSEVTYAFIESVLPKLKEKGVNIDVYYVASSELFDSLSQDERHEIYSDDDATRSMMISGFTRPSTYRWVLSPKGRAHTLHAFQRGVFLGSGSAHKVMEEAGLDGDTQFNTILHFVKGNR